MPFKMLNGELVAITEEEAAAIAGPPVEPPAPPVPKTDQVDMWRRCTDEEAEALELALKTAPARLRRLFEVVRVIPHDAPEFAMLTATISAAISPDRAAAILAPSEGI